ncbi:reconbinase [Bacillus sp. TS-2]|nr:reconbinase [Bacillus sp. TS-2]
MSNKSKLIDELGIKNVVNYLRRSRQDEEREKRTGEDTLSEQKKLMDRVLAEYGTPYDQKLEIGSGDKISTRPIFQGIINDLEINKYDAIAIKDITRMGRGSYTDMGVIYDLLVSKRIYIITPWRIYDPSNPADLRQIRFELFMSREEFEMNRERLNGGRYNSALEGKWVSGPAPFGFDYNEKTGKLMINEPQAEMVRNIYDYYANGIILANGKRKLVQFRALASYLKRVGIKTPSGKDEWSPPFLKTFLEHDRYIGVLRQNTTKTMPTGKKVPRPKEEHIIIEDAHPPIIDMETWTRVQDRIQNRDVSNNTKLDFEPNVLAGLCVCKKCGRKFIRRCGKKDYIKKDGSVSTYEKNMLFCGTNGCTYVKFNPIHDDIIETLKHLSDLDNDVLKAYLKQTIKVEEPKDNKVEFARRIQIRRSELERRMKFIFDKYESGIYTDEMFIERKNEIDKLINDLDSIEIDSTATNQDKEEYDPNIAKENINSVLSAYQSAATPSEKNKVLHSIFSHINIEILEKGHGRIPAVHQIEPYLKSSIIKKSLI